MIDHDIEIARGAKGEIPIGFTLGVVRDTALALHYAHTFTDPLGRKMIAVAVAGYLVGTALGATLVQSDSCPSDRGFFRALGGSVLGGIVGGGIAGAINGRKDFPALATAAFGFLGAPVGAAWALWRCD